MKSIIMSKRFIKNNYNNDSLIDNNCINNNKNNFSNNNNKYLIKNIHPTRQVSFMQQ